MHFKVLNAELNLMWICKREATCWVISSQNAKQRSRKQVYLGGLTLGDPDLNLDR